MAIHTIILDIAVFDNWLLPEGSKVALIETHGGPGLISRGDKPVNQVGIDCFIGHPDHNGFIAGHRQSDLILYNTESNKITHVEGTEGDQYMETYPNWSPDGKSLYFSRTSADSLTSYKSIRYDIYRIAFDPVLAEFGKAEPVLMASKKGKSASFPRISPDGFFLLCTLHDYGTFPIWHKEADLCLVDLSTGKSKVSGIVNSDDTDSYHSWAQNSRWIVFSSRRYDGRYTKLYISYLNKEGQFQKAFLLPQRNPAFYDEFFYSYNRPELITGAIEVKQRSWIQKIREE